MPTNENFRFEEDEVPQPRDGEVLIRTLYLSVDPYMRGRMSDRKSYVPPFELGQPIEGAAVGEVVESRSNKYKQGDLVTGILKWQLYSTARPEGLYPVDPARGPITTALGALGTTGLTAYFGLLDIGKPKPGDTLVISGAAGGVGTMVCQIGKIVGCRVVGIAGSDEKNDYLKREFGVDATINYKTENVSEALKAACPKGVDIYFDNVGGDVSDAVMPYLRFKARIVICGQISMYNLDQPDMGLRPQPFILVSRALMQGFILFDYAARYPEAIERLSEWLAEGKLKNPENIVQGFENTPEAFFGLFRGENLGKQLVKVA